VHRPTTGPVVAYACMTLAYVGYRLSEPLARTVDLMDLAAGVLAPALSRARGRRERAQRSRRGSHGAWFRRAGSVRACAEHIAEVDALIQHSQL